MSDYYNNDDLMQNIDGVGDDTTAIKDTVDSLAKQNIQLKQDIKKLQIDMTYLIGVIKIVNGLDKKAS
tara:strand:- start:98 stop:301 length:204 start_codon:yes stop_codon:yes gene_type:complete